MLCLPAVASAAPARRLDTLEPRAAPARASALVRMSIDPRKVRLKQRTARSFIGLSSEFQHLVGITGNPVTGPNTALEGLLAELRATGSGAPVLRIGGGSADEVWWNPLRRKLRPTGIRHDFTVEDVEALAQFRSRTRSPLILNANLASRSPTVATTLVREVLRHIGRRAFLAVEIGNEPDLYSERNYYLDARKRWRKARPRSYSFGNYMFDFRARARQLRAAVPGVPLAGPGACCKPAFFASLPTFLQRFRRQVRLVSYHAYFGSACPEIRRRNPDYATRGKLLGPKRIASVTSRYASLVAVARRYRKPVRVTETNSFVCGGKPGVSDTFTSALWGLDYMMRMAAIGVSGLDFHTSGVYSPFGVRWSPQRGLRSTANPLYYGMLTFARATANRATILIDPTFTARVRRGANLVPFVTLDRRRTLRVLIINKDSRRSGPARIRVRRGAATARLSRLTARGLGARTGVTTLAGQSVPRDSSDGRLAGARRPSTVRRRGSTYRFRVPRASAALLEVLVR